MPLDANYRQRGQRRSFAQANRPEDLAGLGDPPRAASGGDPHRPVDPMAATVVAADTAASSQNQAVPSAWELACHVPPTTAFAAQRLFSLSVSARQRPSQTVPSGTQRARLERPHEGELLLCQREAANVIIRQAMTAASPARNSLMPPRRAQALHDGDHREHEHGGHRGGQNVGKQQLNDPHNNVSHDCPSLRLVSSLLVVVAARGTPSYRPEVPDLRGHGHQYQAHRMRRARLRTVLTGGRRAARPKVRLLRVARLFRR